MEPTPVTTETRTLPRETLEAVDALERLVRRHGIVNEGEANVALRALLPEGTSMPLEEAFSIARAARPPRPPREPSPRRRHADGAERGEAVEKPEGAADPAEKPEGAADPAEKPEGAADPAEKPEGTEKAETPETREKPEAGTKAEGDAAAEEKPAETPGDKPAE